MIISFSNAAIQDLEQIKEYYTEQGVPHIGQTFIATIMEHIETLTQHPDTGRIVPEFNDELIRELIHVPFRVVYLRERHSINVIRIWHSERMLDLSAS